MFFSIKGKIIEIFDNFIVIENNNIGFRVYVSHPEIFKKNSIEFIFLHNVITQTSQQLIGFKTLKEKNVFISLINIKGIGIKKALNMLHKINYDSIKKLEENNIDSLLKEIKENKNNKNTDNIIETLKKQSLKDNKQRVDKILTILKEFGFKIKEIKDIVSTEIIENVNEDDSIIVKNILKKLGNKNEKR